MKADPKDETSATPARLGGPQRRTWLAAASVILVAMLWSGGCSGDDGVTGPPAGAAETLQAIASDPVSAASAVSGGVASLQGNGPDFAYVSLPPGSIPNGEAAKIRNLRTADSVELLMVDGGFDPVPIEASAGDTLEIEVSVSGSSSLLSYTIIVPPRRPPIVVRTDPPTGKKDVPLNAAIVIVFSEPIDSPTLTESSVQLRRGSTLVAGRIEFRDTAHLIAAFVPAAPLSAASEYELVLTSGIRDLDGDALSAAVEVTFTTEPQGAGPVAQITTIGGNDQVAGLGEELGKHLRVRVADSFGYPIAGAPVTFTVIAGNGSIEDSPVVTDPAGIAESGAWTLGPTPGVQQVRAESGSAQVVFSALAFGPPTDLQGAIAFVSDRDGDSEIYAINADGSGLEQLTTNSTLDHVPAWSPDGSLIAFVSDRDGTPSIYVMTADGSHVMRRTDGLVYPSTAGHELAWSPSGSAIAFTLHDPESHIATMDNDGTVTTLTIEPGVNTQPSWSPDGLQLAFVSDRDAYDFVFNIYTTDADPRSRRQRLTQASMKWPDQTPYYLHPSWSPDGSMIAFVYGSEFNGWDARWKVAIMTANGEFIRDLAWAGDTPRMEDFDPGSLTWSPDGRGIAYTFFDCDLPLRSSCSKVRSVKYVSLDRSEQGTIVENAHSPSWHR